MIKFTTKILFISLLSFPVLFAQNNFEVKTKLNGNNYEEERILQITVNKNGNEVYGFTKELLPFYSVPQTLVFNNGNAVLIYTLEGVIEFYNTKGLLTNKTEFLVNKLYDEHKVLFKKSVNNLALLISENNNNKIFLFDSKGKEVTNFILPEGTAEGIAFSENDSTIAASIYNRTNNNIIPKTFFIDIQTHSNKKFPLLFTDGLFDNLNKTFTGFTNKNIFQIDLISGNILFNKKTKKNKIILDATIADKITYFIEANVPEFNNGGWEYNFANIIEIKENGILQVVKKIATSFRNISFNKNKKVLLKNNETKFSLNIEH